NVETSDPGAFHRSRRDSSAFARRHPHDRYDRSSPFVKRNYNSSTCLSHEKTQEEREGRRGGAVEKERKVENALFFLVVGAHARAIVCLRVISLPNLFYPMEIRHPSECVCCIGVTSYCYVCMCMYTRVNICVLRDNDFSGITL
ncbi:hypothetical protein ALC60_13616, partial [Trachymyrmex zeteki]